MHIVSHDSETPAQGQQVITACALIYHDFDGITKIFLAKRAPTKKFLPNIYEIPGGHIDFGENIIAGLQREIQEELEVDIMVGDPFAVFDYTNPVKRSHSIEVIYFATLVGKPGDIQLHPEDHITAGWFANDELFKIQDSNKDSTDNEFKAIERAFDLLAGNSPNFA